MEVLVRPLPTVKQPASLVSTTAGMHSPMIYYQLLELPPGRELYGVHKNDCPDS